MRIELEDSNQQKYNNTALKTWERKNITVNIL